MTTTSNAYQGEIRSVADGTQPTAGSQGTSITPGASHVYGSYTEVLSAAQITVDGYELELLISNAGVSATARVAMVTLGIDTAGGTSWTDFVADIAVGPASGQFATGSTGGVRVRLPVRVPAGSSLAVKAKSSTAAVTAIRAQIVLKTQPTEPEFLRIGTFVRTFGAVPANSRGTTIVPGTAAEGVWTEIGTLAEDLFAWDFAYCIEDATTTGAAIINVDIGVGPDALNVRPIIRNSPVYTWSTEGIDKFAGWAAYGAGAAGEKVWARAQATALDDSNSITVHGVGGYFDTGEPDDGEPEPEPEQPSSPALGIETTPDEIRDRIITIIEGLTPRSSSSDRFRKYRNEGKGQFVPWAEANATGARRRFQVRRVAQREHAEVSNSDFEELKCTFAVIVAYPQTHRDGPDAALDRDDAIDQDLFDIDQAIGMNGRANFAPPYPDACWRDEGNGEESRIGETIEGNGVDFGQIFVSYSYRRDRLG